MADEPEDADEYGQLEEVEGSRLRQDAPHQPEYRLRPANGPDRSVKVPALVTFAFRRRLDTRQLAQSAEQPNRSRQREVGTPINLLEIPLARDNGDDQARGIQDREGDHLAPRERVADTPVKRVGPIFGEANDVRPRLDTG